MELALLSLLGFLILFVAKLAVKNYTSSPLKKRSPRLPPGPWKLPLVGSLHHIILSRYGFLLHRTLRELSARHGPLMLLRFGAVPTLVVSSAEAAREIMKTHDTAFASRHLTPTLAVLSCSGRDILFSPYDDLWRQLRRLCVLELFSTRRVQSFRHIREDETARLLRSVADQCARSDNGTTVVNIGERISCMINDTVVRSAIGGRCPRRDEFLHEIDNAAKLTSGFSLVDLYPSSRLARLLSGTLRKTERCNRNVRAIMDTIIRERAEGTNDGDSREDLLGVLLKLQRDGGVQCPLTTEIICTFILEIFAAGSETSSTTLEWAISELVRNPDILQKAQTEVREEFQGQRKLIESDISRLSYLHLVIRETLRLHPPAPFLLPRQCQDSCEVMGYDIPEGTKVLVNVWALARDTEYWEDAEAFMPERFQKSTTVDFKGRHFEYIPFGAGRRICPGMALGLANMELVLAGLLYHFDWEHPSSRRSEELDMSEVFGITTKRKSKLVLRATQHILFA